MPKDKRSIWKKTLLRDNLLKWFLKHTKENELKESEYIRDLIREDMKKKLGDGLKRL